MTEATPTQSPLLLSSPAISSVFAPCFDNTHFPTLSHQPKESGSDGSNDENKNLAIVRDSIAGFVLPLYVRMYFAANPSGGFVSDDDFLIAKEVQFVMASWATRLSAHVITIPPLLQKDLEKANVPHAKVAFAAEAAAAVVKKHIDARTSQTLAPAPRLLRVCIALKLTKKEQDAVAFIAVSGCGRFIDPTRATSPTFIARMANMTPQELLHFLGDQRPHIKQGLIQKNITSSVSGSLAESKIVMSQETLSALCGNNLSMEQLMKLEKTALAKVLTDEASGASPSAKKSVGGKRKKKSKKTKKRGKGKEDDNDDDDDAEESSSVSSSDDDDDDDDDAVEEGSDDDGEEDDDKQQRQQTGTSSSSQHPSTTASKASRGSAATTTAAATATGKRQRQQQTSGSGVTAAAAAAANAGSSSSSINIMSDDLLTTAMHSPSNLDDDEQLQRENTMEASADKAHQPYTTDIEYCDDYFKLLSNIIKIRNAESEVKDEEEMYYTPKNKVEAQIRELRGRERVLRSTIATRLKATREAPPRARQHKQKEQKGEGEKEEEEDNAPWLPRVENVCAKLKLCEFEKRILLLLVGYVVSHDMLIAVNGRYVMKEGSQKELTVGYVLFVLCDNLKQRIEGRRAFYSKAPLLEGSLCTISVPSSSRTCFNTDLMDFIIDIDRKMVDFLIGLDTRQHEMVQGSALVVPHISMENVVLPEDSKNLILSSINHYDKFVTFKQRWAKENGCLLGSANGLVLLFYGPSGTGKTLLANGVAHYLGKKLLTASFQHFRGGADALRFVFREAKLYDAIVFFDECDTLFESRETNQNLTSLLPEFEKFDGVIILATNKAHSMDEAMNRRISVMLEFKLPDQSMRRSIWTKHLLADNLAADVDVGKLAADFELSGGLIKNAVLTGMALAVSREQSESPMVTMGDLVHGAKLQLRGLFQATQKSATQETLYITPRATLSDIILEESKKKHIRQIARMIKGRRTLFSQWGFESGSSSSSSSGGGGGAVAKPTKETPSTTTTATTASGDQHGMVILFHGPSGTGKSLAVEAIAYECGATIRVANVAEMILQEEIKVQKVFEEATKLHAFVVFDAAEQLFSASTVGQQLCELVNYYAKRCSRPVFVLVRTSNAAARTNTSESPLNVCSMINVKHSTMQFYDEVEFNLPSKGLRDVMWRKSLPSRVPVDPKAPVDFAALASEYKVSAKAIQEVCFTACSRLAASLDGAKLPQDDHAGASKKKARTEEKKAAEGEEGKQQAEKDSSSEFLTTELLRAEMKAHLSRLNRFNPMENLYI